MSANLLATTATKPAQQGSSSCDSLATSCDKPTESPVDPNLSQRVATFSQTSKPAMTGLVAHVASKTPDYKHGGRAQ